MSKKIAAGRAGGLKGGPARAKTLSDEELSTIAAEGGIARAKALSKRRRSEIARAAALARWRG